MLKVDSDDEIECSNRPRVDEFTRYEDIQRPGVPLVWPSGEDWHFHPYNGDTVTYENRTGRTISMSLSISTDVKPNGKHRDGSPKFRGVKPILVTVQPGASVILPEAFASGVQRTACTERECSGKELYCKNLNHDRNIVGGVGMYLTRVDETVPARLHPTFGKQAVAAERTVKQQATPLADRLAARVGGGS